MKNSTVLVFETTADISDFIMRRKLHHVRVDKTEVTAAGVLTEGDIRFAQKEYKARIVEQGGKKR